MKTALKALAYTVAPKTTFTVRHPRAALRWKTTRYALRHSLAPRISGAAAAAVALPLGIWLGRKLADGDRGRGDGR